MTAPVSGSSMIRYSSPSTESMIVWATIHTVGPAPRYKYRINYTSFGQESRASLRHGSPPAGDTTLRCCGGQSRSWATSGASIAYQWGVVTTDLWSIRGAHGFVGLLVARHFVLVLFVSGP